LKAEKGQREKKKKRGQERASLVSKSGLFRNEPLLWTQNGKEGKKHGKRRMEK